MLPVLQLTRIEKVITINGNPLLAGWLTGVCPAQVREDGSLNLNYYNMEGVIKWMWRVMEVGVRGVEVM